MDKLNTRELDDNLINNEKGFSLFELLYVISILSVISAMAITAFFEYKEKAYEATDMQAIDGALTDIMAYTQQQGYVKNVTAQKQTVNGVPSFTGNHDTVIPISVPSKDSSIFVTIGSCPDGSKDTFIISASTLQSKNRTTFTQECSGARVWLKIPKTPGNFS